MTQISKLIIESHCGFSIPSPTVYSRDSIKWCFQVASDMRSPLIIGVGDESDMSLEEAAELAKKLSLMFEQVPFGLSLENCEDFETAMRAVLAGYANIVMPMECGEELVREVAHLCRAMGARLEAAIDLNSELLDAGGELLSAVNRMQVGGIFINGDVCTDSSEVYEINLAKKLWTLYDETVVLIGIQGEIFSKKECLKLAARTSLSRVTLSSSLSAGGVQSAVNFVFQPEVDRRGLPRLQASICEGFTKELSSYMRLLDAHNRF